MRYPHAQTTTETHWPSYKKGSATGKTIFHDYKLRIWARLVPPHRVRPGDLHRPTTNRLVAAAYNEDVVNPARNTVHWKENKSPAAANSDQREPPVLDLEDGQVPGVQSGSVDADPARSEQDLLSRRVPVNDEHR